ncbi:hypothetical protein CYFUS_000653 [Cystobacter fuscus]|uniref:Cyclic GMP-AMP synthase n=1 Tax=Cystobacter fuscus TaxID=43 RepID=A0A250IVQ2_9BACT|nr:nucleotidyltransferase [Cystobacter fuscus]ATB35241.1 hypothetical protein CYFUS_000653 [Cystobacter fuscus]
MANIQKYFEQFDEDIRLKRFDENQMLREKRDAIHRRLREKFEAMRRAGADIPSFETFNQGSYQMGTGIQPAEGGEYDIDVGLRFNCDQTKYSNPVALKQVVADALEGHTSIPTRMRRSCVTVYYKQNGEQAYHVDLAVYVYAHANSSRLVIAKGEHGSGLGDRKWEESSPQELCDWVENRFSNKEEEAQFLRVIRALKRWKTEKFKTDGQNAPSGIGLTVAAGQWFVPSIKRPFSGPIAFDDRTAMRAFVDRMVREFHLAGHKTDGSSLYRLEVRVPVVPHGDIFERMTSGQMSTFRDRLIQLRDQLDAVEHELDPVDACTRMLKEFGEAFPVPDKSKTGAVRGIATTTSGTSA